MRAFAQHARAMQVTCIQSLTEVGFAATPRASRALALSWVWKRAASSHTSSLVGHSSHPFMISFRASLSFLCNHTHHATIRMGTNHVDSTQRQRCSQQV